MREIIIKASWLKAAYNNTLGKALVIPIHVNWPELRLTEEQILANAVAVAYDKEMPYPDPALISLVLERPSK